MLRTLFVLILIAVTALALRVTTAESHPGSPQHNAVHAIKQEWKHDGPQAVREALCIAKHESGYNRHAWSPTWDASVFQANWRTHRDAGESPGAFRARHARLWWHVAWAHRLYHNAIKAYGWKGRWWPWAPRTRSLCGL